MKKTTISIILSAFLCTTHTASAVVATEMTQVGSWYLQAVAEFEKARSWVQQALDMAEQIALQTRMVSMQLQNLKSLDPYRWDGFAFELYKLAEINNGLDAVYYGVSNRQEVFDSVNKGYEHYVQQANSAPDQLSYNKQYRSNIKDMAEKNRNTFKATFDALGWQAENFESEAAVMEKLKEHSENAEGALQVAQAANDIALFQADQLRQLRVTLMNQANAINQWMASQNEEKLQQLADTEERFLKK